MDADRRDQAIAEALLCREKAYRQLEELESKAGDLADRLVLLVGVVTGEQRNVLQPMRESDDTTTFQVYPPGRCQPDAVVVPTPEELVAIATKRHELMQQIAAAEDILKKHGRLSSLAVMGLPGTRQQYLIVNNPSS